MSAALPTKPTYADVANMTGRGTSVSAPRMSRSVMPYEATSELSLAGDPLIAFAVLRLRTRFQGRRCPGKAAPSARLPEEGGGG